MNKNKKQLKLSSFWSRVLLHKWTILILSLFVLIPIFGVFFGFYYSSLPENNPQRDKKSCESIYGKWLDDEKKCLLSYKKAGESCIDGGQCESGVCFPPDLTESQKKIIANNKLIKNVTGTCYPDNLVFGCVKQVIGGTLSKESMCFEN